MPSFKILVIPVLGMALSLPFFIPPVQASVPALSGDQSRQLKSIDRAIRLRNYAQAVKQLKPMAAKGLPQAEYRLAGLYRSGRGVRRDPDEALRLYRNAAQAGLANAQYTLALLLLKSPRQEFRNEARHWLQLAASQGMSKAQRKLDRLKQADPTATTHSDSTDNSRLFSLVRGNELDRLQQEARRGLDLSRLDEQGNSPLLVALQSGYHDLALWLTEKDKLAGKPGKLGERALLAATRQDFADIVGRLLAKGIDANAADEAGNTALHVATRHQVPAIMKLLLTHGADPGQRNRKGQSPLQLAVDLKLDKAIRLFRQQGLSLPQKNRQLAAPDIKAFEKSIRNQKSLYRGWPMINIASLLGETRILQQLLRQGGDVRAVDPEGNSALHRAASKGRLKSAEILISNGADIDHRNNKGETPLYLAALNGHPKLVKWLLGKGADSSVVTKKHSTALLAAIRSGHKSIALMLADQPLPEQAIHRALLEAIHRRMENVALRLLPHDKLGLTKDKRGRSLLWLAADQGLNRLASALIRRYPNLLDSADKSGHTPLARAVYRGYKNMTDQLIRSKARLDLVTGDGNNLVMLAVLSGKVEVLRKILAYPANINQRNAHGDTALMLAAAAGNLDMVRQLIQAGADLHMRNKNDLTAEKIALRAGHEQVAALIRENGKGLFRIFK